MRNLGNMRTTPNLFTGPVESQDGTTSFGLACVWKQAPRGLPMKTMRHLTRVSWAVLFFAAACSANKNELAKTLQENPQILAEVIRKNPVIMGEAIEAAQAEARQEMARRQRIAEQKEMERYFESPLQPDLSDQQTFRGPASAAITIVEYTDFQCPYCARGASTMTELRNRYKDKVRVTVKHLPLDFHRHARLAAQYYEAIRLQSPEKAWKFHDELFNNQQQIQRDGEEFLKAAAKKVGANLAKVEKDAKSDAVKKKIDSDLAEAQKFGFRGTPSFLVNGVPVRGAVPAEEFARIIDKHLARGG